MINDRELIINKTKHIMCSVQKGGYYDYIVHKKWNSKEYNRLKYGFWSFNRRIECSIK